MHINIDQTQNGTQENHVLISWYSGTNGYASPVRSADTSSYIAEYIKFGLASVKTRYLKFDIAHKINPFKP